MNSWDVSSPVDDNDHYYKHSFYKIRAWFKCDVRHASTWRTGPWLVQLGNNPWSWVSCVLCIVIFVKRTFSLDYSYHDERLLCNIWQGNNSHIPVLNSALKQWNSIAVYRPLPGLIGKQRFLRACTEVPPFCHLTLCQKLLIRHQGQVKGRGFDISNDHLHPPLPIFTTLIPGLHSVTWTPLPSFLLSVIWLCAKYPSILICSYTLELLSEDIIQCNSLQSFKSAFHARLG